MVCSAQTMQLQPTKRMIIIASDFLTQKKRTMKKLLFALMAVGLMASASSCKKCGHCEYSTGGNSSAVCKNNQLGGLLDEYKQAEADCEADGDTWVVHK
jgi:hypothetical protein